MLCKLRSKKTKHYIVIILALFILAYLFLSSMSMHHIRKWYLYSNFEVLSIGINLNDRINTRQWYLTNASKYVNTDEDIVNTLPLKTKHIMWIDVQNWIPHHFQYGIQKDIFSKCKVKMCIMHFNLRERPFKDNDAVILTHSSLATNLHKLPNQTWIFYSLEAPYSWEGHFLPHQINLTMTYRRDSDILLSYANVKRVQQVPSRHYFQEITSRKTKLVAWVVSSCFSASYRQYYVDELSKHISLDILGNCGPMRKNKNVNFGQVEQEYKFYLAFENSLCVDYVTEKFFRTQDLNIVAVVRGAANYSKIYPPDTYINVDDFNSPRELAEHLLTLDKNNEAYIDILQRKSKYTTFKTETINEAVCQLCSKLHNPNIKPKSYPDIYKWYSHNLCSYPKDVHVTMYDVIKNYVRFGYRYGYKHVQAYFN